VSALDNHGCGQTSGPKPRSSSDAPPLVLNLTDDELDIVRSALRNYCRTMRESQRSGSYGYSPAAIEHCLRRMRVEGLMDLVDSSASASSSNRS
jgi:hypothetical protein